MGSGEGAGAFISFYPGRDLIFTRQKAPLGAAFVVRMTSRALPRLIDGPGTERGCPASAQGAEAE